MRNEMSRRDFCRFLTQSAVFGGVTSSYLSSCTSHGLASSITYPNLAVSRTDELKLASGFQSREFIRWGNRVNLAGESFGFNNDFVAFQPVRANESWMWINHESVHAGIVSGDWNFERKKSHVDIEMKNVGGSLLLVRNEGGNWTWTAQDSNKRLDAFSKIPFSLGTKIRGASEAQGTLANCAGGTTSWGTFLSCEENYDTFSGERRRKKFSRITAVNDFSWHRYYEMPPEHYGWVVEITPNPFSAKKLVSLGRFAHEGATVVTAADGRSVVYMGDDAADQCLYKFVSDKVGSLDSGTLYVASLERGEWIPLKKQLNDKLGAFDSDLEILIYTRDAARVVGASQLDRPEDIEVHPKTGAVFVALTNNKPRGRPFGSILKIEEERQDFLSLRFRHEVFVMGGDKSGIACPDNLCFDSRGNLWVTTDMAGYDIGTPLFERFGNNALFVVPTAGKFSGQAFRIAEAPLDAELTGPCFAPDGKSLFLAVQHPGEQTRDPNRFTSHWPDGGNSNPVPAVVEITSELFSL